MAIMEGGTALDPWLRGLDTMPFAQSSSAGARRTMARRCFLDGGCSARSGYGLLPMLLEQPSPDPVALWPDPVTPAIDLMVLA